MATVVNELLTYGIVAINSALPVQGCYDTNGVIFQYPGQTYAMAAKDNVWKRSPTVDFDKKLILTGGYDN